MNIEILRSKNYTDVNQEFDVYIEAETSVDLFYPRLVISNKAEYKGEEYVGWALWVMLKNEKLELVAILSTIEDIKEYIPKNIKQIRERQEKHAPRKSE